MNMIKLVLFVPVFLAVFATAEEPTSTEVVCEYDNQFIRTPDCRGYSWCLGLQPLVMPGCPTGLVFSQFALACVYKGGEHDDCPTSMCSKYDGLIPNAMECQSYYNCSNEYKYVPRFFEQYMMECPYTQLFNTDTMRCDKFENVKCGTRKEYKNGCDYRRNKCAGSHCIPCHVYLPSCEGLEDGDNVYQYRLWSPYFVTCNKERFIKQHYCPRDEEGLQKLFSPDHMQCVSLDMIPPENGGMMPDCSNKTGKFPNTYRRCDRYTLCENGLYKGFHKCPAGQVYDEIVERCGDPKPDGSNFCKCEKHC